MSKIIVGLDIETDDPFLKVSGYSWKYDRGFILATSLYYEAEDKLCVIAGINNENCPYSENQRKASNILIRDLLTNPDVAIVGANLQYDIGWLLYEYGMTTYDVKCSFIDVLQAEHILNENSMDSLDTLSWKYLKYGKKKERIEEACKQILTFSGEPSIRGIGILLKSPVTGKRVADSSSSSKPVRRSRGITRGADQFRRGGDEQ